VRHRPQARLSRTVLRVRGGLGAAWDTLRHGPAPRYAVTVEHAGAKRGLEMDTRTAARVARRFALRPDGAIDFDFAPGTHAYLVQRGNPARFSEPHRVAAFPSGRPGLLRLHLRGEGGAYPQGCRLYTQYHDQSRRLAAFPLTLRGSSQTANFRPPATGVPSIAIRLAGTGRLPPLVLSVTFETAAGPAADSGRQPGELLAFDRLALVAAGAASRVAGIYDPTDPLLAGRHLAFRPDQAVPVTAGLPVAGLVFDDTVPPPFGWQGTFDQNTYANLALVRILGEMERAGLPTILVYDARTEAKPLFPELAALFAHQLRKGPEADANLARLLRLAPPEAV